VAQRATESIMVNAAPETVYTVVTDFANYANWVSDLKRSTCSSATPTDGHSKSSTARGVRSIDDLRVALRLQSRTRIDQLASDQRRPHRDHAGSVPIRTSRRRDAGHLRPRSGVAGPIPHFIKSRAAQRIQTQALGELKARAESLR